jgi:hypothetical protein
MNGRDLPAGVVADPMFAPVDDRCPRQFGGAAA